MASGDAGGAAPSRWAAPFAFLATYTTRLSAAAKAQHLPLGKALQEYSGARNRERLLSLLMPVQRAAEHCPWLKAMVDTGEIFHPLRWSPQQAVQFLKDVCSGTLTKRIIPGLAARQLGRGDCPICPEDKIDQMIESKQQLAGDFLSGAADMMLTEMKDEELLKLVALDLGAAMKEV